MRYLLDTNFISELRRNDRANRGVLAWEMANNPALCALSVATIAEVRAGIEACRGRDLVKAKALEEWLEIQVTKFGGNILPLTMEIADRWGRLIAATGLPERDLILAATALEHDLTLVTRNVADFKGTGVRVVNPWK